VRNQARINNATLTLKSIRLFAEIFVSFGPGKSTQTVMKMMMMIMTMMMMMTTTKMIFSLMKYVFKIGVLSLFFCGFFWTGVNIFRYIG